MSSVLNKGSWRNRLTQESYTFKTTGSSPVLPTNLCLMQEKKEYICKYCNKIIYTTRGGFSNHLRYCESNPNSKSNKEILSIKTKKFFENKKEEDEKTRKIMNLICKNCNKSYQLNLTDNEFNKHSYSDFCKRKCARQFSTKNCDKSLKESKCVDCGKILYIKKNASSSTCRCDECKIKYYENVLPYKTCIVCGNTFQYKRVGDKIIHKSKTCSDACSIEFLKNKKLYLTDEMILRFRECGKKSANIQRLVRRSKNEIHFYEMCKKHFNDVVHNEPIFNGWDADVIIHDIKYAILWNGPWHYKNICEKHSFKMVQNRDKIKIHEIEKFGYIPYVIKDMGKENIKFVEEQFKIFLEHIGGCYKLLNYKM